MLCHGQPLDRPARPARAASATLRRRSQTATQEVVDSEDGLCKLVALNVDRVQAWVAGCAQQAALLGNHGTVPGRRLAADDAALVADPAAARAAAEGCKRQQQQLQTPQRQWQQTQQQQ